MAGFPDTRWSLIERVAQGDRQASETALEEICQHYWQPLYLFLRQSGKAPADAEDLTQGFFASLLRRQVFSSLEGSEHGRLRSFLLTGLRNYLRDECRSANAVKRGEGRVHLTIDFRTLEEDSPMDLPDTETPESIYEKQWVCTLLDRTLDQLEADFLKRGTRDQFAVIKDFLAWNGADISYLEAAEKIGTSEGALKVQIHRLRAKFQKLLRQEVAKTLQDPNQVDEEIRALFGAFS